MASRYRKIEVRIWNDEKFMSLSDDAKLVFLFLLTHPNMTSIGAMRGTMPGLSSELGWATPRLSKGFKEAMQKGLVNHNEKASFIDIKNFLRYNKPESPNVVKSWDGIIELIPECAEKIALIKRVKCFIEAMGKAFAEALPEAFRKGMLNPDPELNPNPNPNPEPEPEPEPEHNTTTAPQGGDGCVEKKSIHETRINLFWCAYPGKRKREQANCLEWLKANIKTEDQFKDLMLRLGEDCLSFDWHKENGKFIPAPIVWLRKKRHLDPPMGEDPLKEQYDQELTDEDREWLKSQSRNLTEDEQVDLWGHPAVDCSDLRQPQYIEDPAEKARVEAIINERVRNAKEEYQRRSKLSGNCDEDGRDRPEQP